MRKRCSFWCVLLLAMCALAGSALADVETDKAAISARLHKWADAFNARDAAGTCDLFAPTLVSTVEGTKAGSRDEVCGRLAKLLARTDAQFHYRPDIQEIIVSGDIAVVRLFWTLTVTRGAAREVSVEAGMDVFERQPNGIWSIIRFIAFTIEPNPPQ